MTADGERDAPGEGASSGEREPVPEVVPATPIGDDADAATIDEEFAKIIAGWDEPGPPSDAAGGWPVAEDLPPAGLPATGLPPAGPSPAGPSPAGPSPAGPSPAGQPPADHARTDHAPTDHAPSLPRVTPGAGDEPAAPGQRVVREPRDAPLPQRPQIWRGFAPPEPDIGRTDPPDIPDTVLPEHVLGALDEGYEPPEPPPLGGDLVSRMSWAAVLGGPLFLVFAVLFWQNLPHLLMLAALAAFVGGFIALVARMPRDRDDDDNDGAVL